MTGDTGSQERPAILVVEDNDASRELLAFLLKLAQFTTLEATGGEEAVGLAAAHRPDLILLDIQLPDIDGLSVCRRIRRIDGMQAVPIVAVSSYAMPGDRERAMAAGCSGYIDKPIDTDRIVDQVRAYLDGA